MKDLILLIFVFVVFNVDAQVKNITNQSNTSDQSYSVLQTNSPTSTYGNRWDIIWLNKDEFHLRTPIAFLDSTVGKKSTMVSTAKFMWVDATTGQIKITPKDSIMWPFAQVVTPDVYHAGSGINITGTSPSFTVTNSIPDQTVSLIGINSTTITGTYPTFTVNSSNTAITASTNISVIGSAPNYTISSTDSQTLSVSDRSITISSGNTIQSILDPVGTVEFYAGSSAPTGYLFCDGSAISRTTYADLFSICGTTYGTGDGSTTFNLPDLRQRFPLTKAVSGTGNTLGATGGTIDHTHTVDPPNTTSGAPSNTSNVTNTLATFGVASTTHTHDVNIASFNSGTANAPFLVLNAIIKY